MTAGPGLVPLYGFLEGDTMGLLVLARAEMTLGEVAAKLASGARVRVAWAAELAGGGPRAIEQVEIRARGAPVAAEATVEAAGLAALDRIDVRRRRTP